ncbi:hypothetical protein [Streptomyces mashuensis]|uniref:hypothetical protein n=1 Tax=Streptomyces mashuensis TaxID=33904 RepID=UPI00167F0D6E|nr:hypothetical protein [Streptomyces mashuensis]
MKALPGVDHDAAEIQRHIEDAYGYPLPRLREYTRTHPETPPSLTALLTIHGDLELAERAVDFHLDRLRGFVEPGRPLGGFDTSHILDCAQRLAQAHATRKAHVAAATVLLGPRVATATTPGTPHPAPRASSTRTR